MKQLSIASTLASLLFATSAMAADVNVFAAASMKNAIDEINTAWKAKSGHAITATYAASSALAKQIEQAAPADVFISADTAWMDDLARRNLVKAESRKDIAGNTLVIVAAKDSNLAIELGAKPNLVEILGQEKLAMADVKAVPAGKYGKAALESLKLWEVISPQVAMQENVRAALALVATGEAKLGIVYGSDAIVEPRVEVAATFPEATHAPILYPAAVVAATTNSGAQSFVDFLTGDEAKAIFKKDGFKVLE